MTDQTTLLMVSYSNDYSLCNLISMGLLFCVALSQKDCTLLLSGRAKFNCDNTQRRYFQSTTFAIAAVMCYYAACAQYDSFPFCFDDEQEIEIGA